MPPSAGEILEGHGIITSRRAFHTYVVCPNTGDNWQCHGLPYTPMPPPLCSGNGSHILAKCIEGGDEAGLGAYYGTAGVCHQMANRILAAAGVEIPLSAHAHVRATRLTFRKFGLNLPWMPSDNLWPNRMFRCQSFGTSAGLERSDIGQVELSGVIGSMTQPTVAFGNPDPISDMVSMVEAAGLDHQIDRNKIIALAQMQKRLQDRIVGLAQMYREHNISSKVYIEELDRALREAEAIGTSIIERNDFYQIFGELTADQIVDLEEFSKEHGGRLSY